ncbi:MAG: GNAT family N-acetyltransferase [Opitutaceae bacterium]|jgi:L-amino acid N-acyltransferase YncA
MRAYQAADLPAVAAVYRESVRQIAPAFYTHEQVEAWAVFADGTGEMEKMMAQGFRLVIESDAGIEAFALLDPADYISLLYCRGRASRRGFASQLLTVLEAEARLLGVERVHTAASLVSHPLFLRHGYTVDHPERVERHGVVFDRYRMSKQL